MSGTGTAELQNASLPTVPSGISPATTSSTHGNWNERRNDDIVGELIPYRSYDADAKLRTMAKELNDTALIAKLSAGGDVIALDAHYHFDCLKSLRNKYR